jgi:hypothetical protein
MQQFASDPRARRCFTDDRARRRPAERLHRRQPRDCFEHIRLAHAVGSDQRDATRWKRDVEMRVRPEVDEDQLLQMQRYGHDTRTGISK